jgi:hypothetical protein
MGFADNSLDKTDCSLSLFQRISPAPKDKKVALGIAVGGEIKLIPTKTIAKLKTMFELMLYFFSSTMERIAKKQPNPNCQIRVGNKKKTGFAPPMEVK